MYTCIAYVEHPVTGGMDMAIPGAQFEEGHTSHLDTLTERNRVGDMCPPTLFYAPDDRVLEVSPVVEGVAIGSCGSGLEGPGRSQHHQPSGLEGPVEVNSSDEDTMDHSSAIVRM